MDEDVKPKRRSRKAAAATEGISEAAEAGQTEMPQPADAVLHLGGGGVSFESVMRLAPNGVFPFSVLLDNNTVSNVVFAGCGVMVRAYGQNEVLTFTQARELESFVCDFEYFAGLWDWNDSYGVIVKGWKNGADGL